MLAYLKYGILLSLVILVTVSCVSCQEGPKKLRRYKICNGTACKAIRSFQPPSFLQEMDSFLYSRWTRWITCTPQCTTKRHRSCKFPMICGNTVIHEEAFCYRRGSYCEYIFENNQRDYLADDVDYLDPADYEFHSAERRLQIPALHELNTNELDLTRTDSSRKTSGSVNQFSRHENALQSRPKPKRNGTATRWASASRNNKPAFRTTTTTEATPLSDFDVSESPFPIHDYDNFESQSQTCGVARITDRNRNGIVTRILGGQEAMQGRWPWQVAILNKLNEAFCGGTLISPRWILTAAHCIRKRLHVTIGEHHLHRDEGTERHFKIEAAFIHPDFDHETVDNDVALLLLPEPVPVEAGLACLPQDREVLPPPGTLCTILGWGKERHTHVFGTSVLHEGQVPLVSTGECKYTYGRNEITSNMFCAGYRTGVVDSCAGDSGGPILCSVNSRWTVFGVTSFGDGCGRKGKYGIYAKVPNYVTWIQKVMRANDFGY